MTRRMNPQQLKGGWQLGLFDGATEPEPAPVAGPVPPATAAWAAERALRVETGPDGWAVMSADSSHRVLLGRTWDHQAPPLVWVMLNPSTADGTDNDRTTGRCRDFAEAAGHGGIVLVNLFTLRSTDPTALRQHPDPIGEFADDALLHATAGARVVAAWGDVTQPHRQSRARAVVALLASRGVRLDCLGTTAKGHPRHPLMVRAETALIPYEGEVDQ
ncbi:DUF1643 domain-containing protein [Streptomyces sp. NPDC088733]|uniref:DUF1643 domain-containing protein n=1 Tax=Streptomyces sp. NPDC088733 TaxID=3365880 RepID=UPI0038026A47